MSRQRQDVNQNSSTSETQKRGIYRHDKSSSSRGVGGVSAGQNTSTTGYTPSGDAVVDSSSQSTTTPEDERVSPDRMIDDAANSIMILSHSNADTLRLRKSADAKDLNSNDSAEADFDPTPSYGLQDNPSTPQHSEDPITRRRANLAPPTPTSKSPGQLPSRSQPLRNSRKRVKAENASSSINRTRSLPTPSTSGSSGDKEFDPQAFANEGIDLWNRRRETWTGGRISTSTSTDNAAALARIKPENYLGIYESLVYERKRLARPISLPFVVKVLRTGWIRDGLWPADAPNPTTTQTEEGEGEGHGEGEEDQDEPMEELPIEQN